MRHIMRKVTNRKDFLKKLKQQGFVLVKRGNHDKYKNYDLNKSIAVPTSKKFSIPLHNRLLKEIKTQTYRVDD
jgi:predicted RNA binding protein YcfA (HicA-like mRNA interferase family)